MPFTPGELKEAAFQEKARLQARVTTVQGGIATYFDVFLGKFLDSLAANESVHRWDAAPRPLSPLGKSIRRLTGRRFVPDMSRSVAELQWLIAYLESKSEDRFVPYESRRKAAHNSQQSDIRSTERMMSQGKAGCLTWKGQPLFKTVFDFAILPMLLWELRPGTVFEIGSGTGTSARWIADLLEVCGLSAQVYSVDIEPIADAYPGVQFLGGDCKSPGSLFPVELLRTAPRPYLVIEDASVNVENVLRYIDGFLNKGDYLYVEDSLVKADVLESFLGGGSHRYLVDTRYTDYFGRNATSAINSILVKI